MSILTEEEIEACATDDGSDDLAFARAIESALLAKLAGMELPEPIGFVNKEFSHEDTMMWQEALTQDHIPVYTAIQLHQAFAQGAASQLMARPAFWSYRTNGEHEHIIPICPPDDAYDEGTLTPLYTLKEPS